MDSRDAEDNLARFDRLRDAFGQAAHRGACRESHYRFAGNAVRLRAAGEILTHHLQAPFAHLRDDTAAEPVFTIDLWDARETGVPGLGATAAHAIGQTWDLGDSVFAATPDGRFVSHEVRGAVVWLDRETQRVAGWFADAGDLSLHQRAKPLQVLLAVWASDRGLQAVHAGLVARDGRGVLLPGRSGAGKSTAALCCLHAGYTYVGDDWIGIDDGHEGPPRGYGLYASALLACDHAARFPRLQPYVVPPTAGRDAKALLLLSPVFPEHLAPMAAVCALALPRIVDAPATTLRAASKKEALLTLVTSSIFTMQPRGTHDGVDRLARLVQDIPAYWLDMGHDLGKIPQCVDEILADVASRGEGRS